MGEERENNYKICYEKMCKEFYKYNPEDVAQRSKAYYDSKKKQFTLTYFNKEYLIAYPDGNIVLKDNNERHIFNNENRMLVHKMLILSYLYRATNGGLTNKWVPFRELEGVGYAYHGFAKSGIDKLIEIFGNKGELFLKAGFKLGGEKVKVGDVGIKINVLPNVPMIFGLWLADDEFPADATILYDCSAVKELHVEDLAGLCSIAVDEIVKNAELV